MANPEHVKWLLEGVEAWNQRRRENPFVPDLSSVNISLEFAKKRIIKYLDRLDLSGINLRNANLKSTYLINIVLDDADLREAELICSKIWHCKARGVFMPDAKLQNADISETDFSKANLVSADLVGAKFEHVELIGAQLYHIKLSCNNPKATADLRGADLASTKIGDAQIWKAKLFQSGDQTKSTSIESLEINNLQNINDLFKLLSQLDKHYSAQPVDDKRILYFRGEQCDCWDLRPSVMRQKDGNFIHRSRESKMLTDLMTAHPESFERLTSSFSQLVLAQHYGLPTRLLDITRTPFVGLFYACQGCSSKECSCKVNSCPKCSSKGECSNTGQLHMFVVPNEVVKPFNSDTISVIANFARLTTSEQNGLLSKTDKDAQQGNDVKPFVDAISRIPKDDYKATLTRLRHFIAQEKPYFENRIDYRDFFRVFVVEPQQSFDRLRAQSGAFLISAFHERFETDQILERVPYIPDNFLYDHYTFTIPKESKEGLLEELRWLNITPDVLSPELDTAAEEIKKRYMQG